jgi:hypothetical protein
MKNIFFIPSVCLVIFSLTANAQSPTQFQLVQYDIKGLPVTESAYTEVEGNPYLLNDWSDGSVVLEGDKSAPAKLKYDVYKERLLFQDSKGETMELKNKLLAFTLNNSNSDVSDLGPMVFVNGLPAVGARNVDSWYQLIANGKVKLLKYYRKVIKEDHPYASATITKTFIPSSIYYVFKDGQLTEINVSKKSLLKVFDNHSAQAEAYLKTNNINFKSDVDLQKLFTWYNLLN